MKKYIVYDYRALNGNTDDSTIFAIEDTLKDAIESAEDFGGVIYSYDVTIGDTLINERFEKSIEVNENERD